MGGGCLSSNQYLGWVINFSTVVATQILTGQ